MTRLVQCLKLHKEAEGLSQPPLPGQLGEKIYQSISNEAWQMWIAHQTMLINEYRLNMGDSKARVFLLSEMEKFLFNSSSNP